PEDVAIGKTAETAPPNSLPGAETTPIPQKDLLNTTGETIPGNSAGPPVKNDSAIPAAAALPFTLPQAGDSTTRLPLKAAPSPAEEKPTANAANRRGPTETVARPSKNMT